MLDQKGKGDNSDRVVALLSKEFSDCGLEIESTGNLDDTVQSTPADGVRRSDLAESWTVDIEDGVASSAYAQTGGKNSGQKVSVIHNIERVRTNLETHLFIDPDGLCQRHVQFSEQCTFLPFVNSGIGRDRPIARSVELRRCA